MIMVMNVLMVVSGVIGMNVSVLMGVHMGVAVAGTIGMNMFMLVVMSPVMRMVVIMSVSMAVARATGMNMLMLVAMNLAMGMLMSMLVGVAVRDAIGVNVFMPLMVVGVASHIKHGGFRLASTSAMPAHQAASSNSMVLMFSSSPCNCSSRREPQPQGV
jgi:hypothetical protein